jgi:hypothetical protein
MNFVIFFKITHHTTLLLKTFEGTASVVKADQHSIALLGFRNGKSSSSQRSLLPRLLFLSLFTQAFSLSLIKRGLVSFSVLNRGKNG